MIKLKGFKKNANNYIKSHPVCKHSIHTTILCNILQLVEISTDKQTGEKKKKKRRTKIRLVFQCYEVGFKHFFKDLHLQEQRVIQRLLVTGMILLHYPHKLHLYLLLVATVALAAEAKGAGDTFIHG